MTKAKSSDNGKVLTEYVVLERIECRAEPVDENPLTIEAWEVVTELVGETDGPKAHQPRIFKAAGKTQAIRAHTGEGADVIEGTWKAVPLSSFRGGETTKRVTASERLPFEDAA
jgi:hypothetical protein